MEFFKTLNRLVFPYKYLQDPSFEVPRNLMPWDKMLDNLS
jgi:hypothetical protein